MNTTKNHSIQSVVRAATIIQLIADSPTPMMINQITEITDLNRTTVWRLLETLESLDYVERDPVTKGYQLGYAPYRLFTKTNLYGPLIRRARPILEKLRDETNETVLLSVPKHNGTLTIDQIDAPYSIRAINYVNKFLPSHCTSNGKILLSRLPSEELELILERPLKQVTSFTITETNQLKEEIEWIRKYGFSLTLREWDESENGISAAILDERDELIGFVSLLGPYHRLTKEKMIDLAPKLKDKANSIANLLK
ncbi:IclR family transcriptional regulator [Halobacillus salinarum]|uniref:IclR family transcriptional regulator n=1 Tax=Halobacillus salinarum TaxID=2932257 RepID=A0ABY4EJD7_9BACI|nr:IclR family transcriptional regulator [Halobacillus salinarum]UOQ44269.1 IclR family transcriptional regulator [Halobacillus salinarum]